MFLGVREMEFRKLHFDESYPPGEIKFEEDDLHQSAPLKTAGTAELVAGTQQIRVYGHLATEIGSACVRCLEPTKVAVDTDFDLFYRPDDEGELNQDVELRGADANIGFYSGDGIELEEVLREQILLTLPMRMVCREDCRGICPVCGENRNLRDCRCQTAITDDRWSALKNI